MPEPTEKAKKIKLVEHLVEHIDDSEGGENAATADALASVKSKEPLTEEPVKSAAAQTIATAPNNKNFPPQNYKLFALPGISSPRLPHLLILCGLVISAIIISLGALHFSVPNLSAPANNNVSSTPEEPTYTFDDVSGEQHWQPVVDQLSWTALNNLTHSSATRMETVLPLCLTAAAASILAIYARRTRRKHIKLDTLGIMLGNSDQSFSSGTFFLPWACLTKVTVQAKKNSHRIFFLADNNHTSSISWKELTACIEPGTFINALRTYAPAAAIGCQFPGQAAQLDTNTYTQLWFKYYSTASERQRTNQLGRGDQLQAGRYEISTVLGGGGQGTAYLAFDRTANSDQILGNGKQPVLQVVLKEYILPVHRGERVLQQTVQKLEQEAAILARVDQANIVKMLDCFIEDHRGYLVMEFIEGRSLEEIVQMEGPQPESSALDIALQVADVLTYLHALTPAIVHRDLTPDNLILQEDGKIKLVDFNVAHQLESAATATVVGKQCYIPPEQFRGKPTAQSDIYAFGGTLYYLLTGEDPEPLTPSRPKEKRADVSAALDQIVKTATSVDAGQRFTDVAAMKMALAELKNARSNQRAED